MAETNATHPGEIVKVWREGRGLSTAALATMVDTSRQNIDNLEKGTVRNPHYLPRLAKVMGYASSDELRQLRTPPPVGGTRPLIVSTDNYFVASLPETISWEVVMKCDVLLPDEFVVEMPDGALAPRLAQGTRIWFRRASRALPRNVVVVESLGRRWIRRYAETEQGPLAQALDDAYPSFRDFQVVAVMHMRADSSI